MSQPQYFSILFPKKEIVDKIRHEDDIKYTALKIRKLMLDENFDLQEKLCDVKEIDDAWNRINIHKEVLLGFI